MSNETAARTYMAAPRTSSNDSETSSDEENDGGRCPVTSATVLTVLLVFWLVSGTVLFLSTAREEESKDVIITVYGLVQILTTVGYGDVLPRTTTQKLLMSFYLLSGVLLASLVISVEVQRIVARISMAGRQRMLQASGMQHLVSLGSMIRPTTAQMQRLRAAGLAYFLMLLAGALFYGFFDTCSDTFKNLEDEHPGECKTHRTLIDAWYMSCATLSTVGYGDQTPSTWEGRLFAIIWMFLGVAAMANFSLEFSQYFVFSEVEKDLGGISHSLFEHMDADHSGTLTKFEFVSYMLVKHQLIAEEDVDLLLRCFDCLDTNGNGVLSYEEAKVRVFSNG